MSGKGKGGNTVETVRQIAEPIAESLGLELWDVRFVKEGGVGIEDCENMSRAIDAPLDEADPIEQSYCLEVSSPGLERELTRPEHFERYSGSPVKVKFIRPVNGIREYKGILESSDGKTLVLRLDDGTALDFDKKETSYIRADDFE